MTAATVALLTHFSGQAAITINDPRAPGANVAPLEMDLVFNAARTTVAVANFVPIVTKPFPTPLGMNTTKISLQSGGNGSYNAGNMAISLVLFFDHSIDLLFIKEDSTFPLLLTTDQPGSPVNAAGDVVLAGTGTFQGGFLNGRTGDVTLTGRISPHP
jgi:hypothetical protein